MRRTVTTWLLGGLLALTGTAWAQNVPAAGEEGETGRRREGHSHRTVKEADIKTWKVTIEDRDYEVHPFTPTYEGTTGLFHLPSAYTLPKRGFAIGLFRDNLDRDPKDLDASTHGLAIGFGLTHKLELFGHIGLQQRNDTDALFQAGYPNEFPFVRTPWETGFGDVKLGLKYKFLDDYMGDPVALAVRGWAKLPTADEEAGLGTGKASFGADLMLSKGIGDGIADVHGLIGWRKNVDPDDRKIHDALHWGVGVNIPACFWVQLQAEVTGYKYDDDPDVAVEITNPADLVVGPVFWIKPGFFIRPALSWNLNFDDRGLNQSSKSWTGRHLMIGYHPGTACREIERYVPPPVAPAANRPPTVNCEIEKSMVQAGEMVGVRANASDADGDTLSYSWTTSAGKIVGSGPRVTLDTTGLTGPSTITCTVTVTDGRGGTASSSCSTQIPAPARAAETEVCESGGFPPNMARLNNVDKACLDRFVARLKADPRSRLVITGHADKSERTPEVIARKRAEAVKVYLVKAGVPDAQITVRSAAATRPRDPGTSREARARNRRVELTFVPEGAKVPDLD